MYTVNTFGNYKIQKFKLLHENNKIYNTDIYTILYKSLFIYHVIITIARRCPNWALAITVKKVCVVCNGQYLDQLIFINNFLIFL